MIPHADFIITRRDVQRFADSGAFECFAFPDGVQQVQFLDLCQGEPTEERVRHCIWALRFDEQPDAHRRRVCLALGMVGWVGDSGDKLASRVYATLQDWFRGNASDVMLRDLLKETSADSAACRAACYALHVVLAAHRSDQCYWLGFCAQAAIAKRGEGEVVCHLTAMRNLWSDPTRLPEHDKPEPDGDDEGEDAAPEPEAPPAAPEPMPAMQATAYTEADAHRDAQAYADSVRQALKEDAAIPAYVKANIAALRTEVAALQDTISTMQAEQAMHRMFFALVDVHRRLNAIEAEEKAVKQGLIATAAKARALGVQVPAPIAEAK